MGAASTKAVKTEILAGVVTTVMQKNLSLSRMMFTENTSMM